MGSDTVPTATAVVLLLAGLIFLTALLLGV
jgi:hypothetical protein